jgi:hypothetical protein
VNPAVTADGACAPSARTCFSRVRFGNVLGSSGSVVPLFREQVKNGGPIPEAAQLVIQAGAMGNVGNVFVLDMGQPVRIYDLASRMAEMSGLRLKTQDQPEGDIKANEEFLAWPQLQERLESLRMAMGVNDVPLRIQWRGSRLGAPSPRARKNQRGLS